MSTQEQNLSAEQQAVGASVGADCQPCSSHQDCGCGTHNDETQASPITAEQPDPVTTASCDESEKAGGADAETDEAPTTAQGPSATTGGHAPGCAGMATQFAGGDAFGPMARCHEMFERFMSAAAPAETTKAPTTTTPAGACKKEA